MSDLQQRRRAPAFLQSFQSFEPIDRLTFAVVAALALAAALSIDMIARAS